MSYHGKKTKNTKIISKDGYQEDVIGTTTINDTAYRSSALTVFLLVFFWFRKNTMTKILKHTVNKHTCFGQPHQ